MKRLCLLLISISLCIAGCTSGYRVHVNGFSEPGLQIRDRSSVFVTVDPNSQNPIFAKEIKTKIEELLKWYEYIPVSSVEQSDYLLAFQVGIDSVQTSGFTPLFHPYVGFHGGYWRSYHFGYTTYVPYHDTFYNQRLVVKVFANDRTVDSAEEQIVWVGEAMMSTSGEDIRRTIDYLLVACFEFFGADTSRQRGLVITEDDPRIIQIESLR